MDHCSKIGRKADEIVDHMILPDAVQTQCQVQSCLDGARLECWISEMLELGGSGAVMSSAFVGVEENLGASGRD